MRRGVWFAAGAGAGVLAMARARRIADSLTPEGLSDRLAALALGLHLFGDEIRAGATEKETELRQRLGLTPHGGTTPQLSSAPGRVSAPSEPTHETHQSTREVDH